MFKKKKKKKEINCLDLEWKSGNVCVLDILQFKYSSKVFKYTDFIVLIYHSIRKISVK